MWWTTNWKQRYEAVASDEDEELRDLRANVTHDGQASKKRGPGFMAMIAALLLTVAGLIALIVVSTRQDEPHVQADAPHHAEQVPHAGSSASGCPARREWRSLSRNEQSNYISAVLCLRTQPSALAPDSNRTAYDDFPKIHSHVGYFTHNSAPFLPWHRYFLHIYETTLRQKCQYQGALVYWDWTLDSEALELSPVFNSDTGFGGDGEVGGEITVGRSGRCLIDGPFAGVTADYYDVKYNPHCLSRGFRDLDGKLGHIDGHDISPKSIEEILNLSDYDSFVQLMESRVHDAIPFGIAGDFETFTAPYDPLFFLHHIQLDRLWWLWQQRQPNNGLDAYGGHQHRHSLEMASLDDEIKMQGLALSIKVSETMDISNDILCYTYE